MDNVKKPFSKLKSAVAEDTLKTQRVEIYLNDLKERLKELLLQHEGVIQKSVDIINEIDEVSSRFLLSNSRTGGNDNATKIKKLIHEFETSQESNSTKTTMPIDGKVDIRKILQNFNKLNESHLLNEGIDLFKRAKESLEKIDTFLSTQLESVNANKARTEPYSASQTGVHNKGGCPLSFAQINLASINNNATNTIDKSRDGVLKSANLVACTSPPKLEASALGQIANNNNYILKDRINMVNGKQLQQEITCNSGAKDLESPSFASCCSSLTSVDVYQSTENICIHNLCNHQTSGINTLEVGYEGDSDDSEWTL